MAFEFRTDRNERDRGCRRCSGTFIQSFELRLRADVPIAFCLSGGVDLSALASIAAKHFNRQIHAFSIIDPDERYDETKNIQETVGDLGCQFHEILTTQSDFLDRLAAQIAYHDAPIATISYYVHAFISAVLPKDSKSQSRALRRTNCLPDITTTTAFGWPKCASIRTLTH